MMGKLRKMSKTYYLRQIVACLLVYCILLAVPMQVALAGIGDGTHTVVAGAADVSAPGGGADAYINMLSDRAVINWNDFDTIAGQLAAFVKSSGGNFAVLNRIIGANPTLFNGNLYAPDGDVFIVNTRGLVFGPTSYIQARNLVASGIDIRNDDFMDGGSYQFESFPETPGHPYSDVIGNVTNKGLLTGIDAESVALIGKNVTNIGTIRTTAPDGAVVMAAGESVLLNEVGSNIVVQAITMTDPAQHLVYNTGTFEASSGNVGKVILAAGDIYSTAISGVDSLSATANEDIILLDDIQAGEIVMEAGQDITLVDTKTMVSDGTLTLEADRNVILGGAVTAGGTMTLKADADDSGGIAGGTMLAKSALGTTAGNIEISASDDDTIYLLGDVDAAVDLKLHNTTVAGPGITLEAGNDVVLADDKTLTGFGTLTVEADRDIVLGGAVTTGGTMTLRADKNTDTVGDMRAKSTLTTTAGDIDIYGNAIDLDDNVYAAHDLLLNNNTVVAADKKLNAGRHVTLADDKTLDGEGALNVEAGDNITLGGAVESAGTLTLIADKNLNTVGDMRAKSTLTTTAGHIDIYGNAILLDDNVDAAVDLNLNNNTWVADGKKLDAGRDVIVGDGTADGTTLTGAGDLEVEADRHITLGGAVVASDSSAGNLILKADAGTNPPGAGVGNMTAYGTITNTANGGGSIDIYSSDTTIFLHDDVSAGVDLNLHNNTWAADEVVLDAGQDVVLAADKTLTGDGDLTVMADENIILGELDHGGDVIAGGDLILDAGDDIYAYGKLITTDGSEGDIHLYSSDSTTHLFGDVTADVTDGGSIFLHNNAQVTGGVTLKAGEDVILDDTKTMDGVGVLTVEADRDIILGGAVTADGTMTLKADADTVDHESGATTGGLMHAKSTLETTTGDIDIYGNYILLDDNVTAAQDLILNNDTTVAADKTLKAEGIDILRRLLVNEI